MSPRTKANRTKTRKQNNEEDKVSRNEELDVAFSESGHWETSVALLVGETHKAKFFIDQLKKTVDSGIRRHFTFLDVHDFISTSKTSHEHKTSKKQEKSKISKRGSSKEKSPPSQKKTQSGRSSESEEGTEVRTVECVDEVEWSLPLGQVAMMVKSKLMELKGRTWSRDGGRVSDSEGETKPQKSVKKFGKASGDQSRTKVKGKEDKNEKKVDAEDGGGGMIERTDENRVKRDEPKDGPSRYFLLSGFHHPHLVTHLSDVGVGVNAIFRVKVGRKGLCYLEKRLRAKKLTDKDDPNEAEIKNEHKNHLQMDERLKTFWHDIFLLLNKQPSGSPSQDVVNFDLPIDEFLLDGEKDFDIKSKKRTEDAVDLKDGKVGVKVKGTSKRESKTKDVDFTKIDKCNWINTDDIIDYCGDDVRGDDDDNCYDEELEHRRMELFGWSMFDRVAKSLYSLVMSRRHWGFYRDALKLTSVATTMPVDAVGALESHGSDVLTSARPRYIDSSFYKGMMDSLNPDMVSIPLIVYCMREQICHWEEELKEKIFPEHGITLSDRLIIKPIQEVEMNTVHNFNNCSSEFKNFNYNNDCDFDDDDDDDDDTNDDNPIKNQTFICNNASTNNNNDNNNDNNNNGIPCDSNLNLMDECPYNKSLSLQRIMDYMGRSMLQLALSDEEKQKIKRLFNHPIEAEKKAPPCKDPPRVVGYHDETSKRLDDPKREQCLPLAFDPLKAELEMLSLTRSADIIRLAELCFQEPDLIKTRSEREMRMEELLCCFNQRSPRINKTELDHYLTLRVIEYLPLKKTNETGLVVDNQTLLIPLVQPIVWDDPYQNIVNFNLNMSTTNTLAEEAELICRSIGENLKCSQKRILEEYCYEEAIDAQSLLQRLHNLLDTHPYLDAHVRRTDGSLIVALHNPFDECTRTRNYFWRTQAFSDCGLRNFLQFFKDKIINWLDMREMKYQVQKLETESTWMSREIEEASKAMEKCKMPHLPDDFYIRKGSIKAAMLEEERKEQRMKEQEQRSPVKKTREESPKQKKKSSKLDRDSKMKSGKESKSKGSGSRSRSGSSKVKGKSEAREEKEGPKTDQSGPREANMCQYTGYDIGDDVISLVGKCSTMHASDGGVIEVEQIVFKQSRHLSRTTLKKDGHFFTIHFINPTPVEMAGNFRISSIPTIDPPIRNDKNTNNNSIYDNNDNHVNINNSAKQSKKTHKGKTSSTSSESSTPEPPTKTKTDETIKNETKLPCSTGVSEFASFVGLLSNGLSISYSIFGNHGEPIGGKPCEPSTYIPPVQTEKHGKEEKSASKVLKNKKKGKKLSPVEDDEASRPESPEQIKSHPDRQMDEQKKEEIKDEQKVKEEEEMNQEQKFNQLFVCRKDGLQVTIMLESSLGIKPDNPNTRNLITKMTKMVPYVKPGNLDDNPCCRTLDFCDEKVRYITRDGNAVIVMLDGLVKILFADGMVKELRPISSACLQNKKRTSRGKEEVEDPKLIAKTESSKTKNAGSLVDGACPDSDLCWLTTCPSGERYAVLKGGSIVHLKPFRVYTVSDPQTKEVMTTREDHVISVLKPDGTLVVEHSNCTRITTQLMLNRDDSSCIKFDKTINTIFVVECPSYPTISWDLKELKVKFDVERCLLECRPEGSYKFHLEDLSMICIDREGTATYLGQEVIASVGSKVKGQSQIDASTRVGRIRKSLSSTSPPGIDEILNREAKNRNEEISDAAKDVKKFLKFVESQKVAGVYVMKHGEDVALDTTDSTGRQYIANKVGEAKVCFVRDFRNPIPVTNFASEDFRIFNILGPRKAVEFLKSNEVENELMKAKIDPEANLLTDRLFDGCKDTNSFGVMMTRTYRRNIQSKTRKPGCGYERSIIPKGLRSRSFVDFPAKEEKKPGISFGRNAGIGLNVISWSKPCGDEVDEIRVKPHVEEELLCGCNQCAKVEKGEECKEDIIMVEKRQFYLFPSLDDQLRKRMELARKLFFESKLKEEKNLKEMKIFDPRTDEEKVEAEKLRQRMLCVVDDEDGTSPIVTNQILPQQRQECFIIQNIEEDNNNIKNTAQTCIKSVDGDIDNDNSVEPRDHDDNVVEPRGHDGDDVDHRGDDDDINDTIEYEAINDCVISNFESTNNGDDDRVIRNFDDRRNGDHDYKYDFQIIANFDVRECDLFNNVEDCKRDINFCDEKVEHLIISNNDDFMYHCVGSNDNNITNNTNNNINTNNDTDTTSIDDTNNDTDTDTDANRTNNDSNINNPNQDSHQSTSQILNPGGSNHPPQLSFNHRVGTLALLNPALNFGSVLDGRVYSFVLQLKNFGLESKKFRVKLPPPSTGLRVLYHAVPIPAGLKCNIEIQLYASTSSSSSSSPSMSSLLNKQLETKSRELQHDLEIVTDDGRLVCRISANVISGIKYNDDVVGDDDDGGAISRTPGVKRIKQKLPAGTELFRAWKTMKQATKTGL